MDANGEGDIMRSRNFVTAMSGLLGLVLFAAGTTANGDPPEKFDWVDVYGGPTTVTWEFLQCNGFGTEMTITFQGFWVVHPESRGRGQFEFYQSITPVRISNADDPSIYVESAPGSHVTRHWVGEGFNSDFVETGVQIMITLPGYGMIFRDVGRLRIDWDTFEAEFIAGEWDSWLGGDSDALCAALSPES